MDWVEACRAALGAEWSEIDLSSCAPFGFGLEWWIGLLGLTAFGVLAWLWKGARAALLWLPRLLRRRLFPERFDDPALIGEQPEIVGRRRELAALRRAFARHWRHRLLRRTAPAAVAVTGQGGYGKTALAIAVARANRRGVLPRYRGVWMVNALTLSSTRDGLAGLGRRLGVAVPENAGEGVDVVLDAMAARGGRWLLIHDNVDEPERMRAMARQLGHPDRIDHLITSQIADWPEHQAEPFPLDLPAPEEATALLARDSGRARAAVRSLAVETLDRHPLALVIAGQMLARDPALAPETLAARFVERLRDAPEGTPYTKSVHAVVSEAYDRLGEQARALMRLAAVLAPDDVSPDHLAEGAAAIADRGWAPLPQTLAPVATDAIARGQTFAEARRHSLLRKGTWTGPAGAAQPTHVVHGLTQLVLRQRIGARGRALYTGYAARLGAAQFTDNPQFDQASWPRYHRLAPQAVALAPLAGAAAEADRQAAARFVHNAAVFLRAAVGDLSAVRRLCEDNLPVVAAAFGAESDDYAAALGNLANVLDHLGEDAEAERRYREAIAVREAATGPDDPARAYDRNNLGHFYWRRGRFAEAEAELAEALRLRLAADGERGALVGSTYGNLGALYSDWADATGDAEKRATAGEYTRTALDLTRAALGPMHLETAARRHNLAAEHHRAGEHPEALAQQMRAAAVLHAMHAAGQIGPEHPKMAVHAAPLPMLLEAAGRARDAARLDTLLAEEARRVAEEHAAWARDRPAGDAG